jgi:hypothetical protein
MISANRVEASAEEERSVMVSAAGERRSAIEEIVIGVTVRHKRTPT